MTTTTPRSFQHLISTPVHTETCTRCGQPTLRALADGIDTRCDPQPLTIEQELAAVLAGQPTYSLQPADSHYLLIYRDEFHIRSHQHGHIVTRHQCAPDGRTRNPNSVELRRAAQDLAASDDPPF